MTTPDDRSKDVEVAGASGDALAEDTLTKVSVFMTAGAMTALDRASETTEDTRTDTMNRAMHVYAALVAAEPGTTIRFDLAAPGGRRRRVSVTE